MSDCSCCLPPRIIVQGDPPLVPVRGSQQLPANVPLQGQPSGAWTDTGLEITLPEPGTYALDANVRCNLSGASPLNTWITARLFDETAGAVVPDSEFMVIQQIVSVSPATTSVAVGGNTNATLNVEYTVTAPTTIRVEAQRTNTAGVSTTANVLSDAQGRTSLRFEKVA